VIRLMRSLEGVDEGDNCVVGTALSLEDQASSEAALPCCRSGGGVDAMRFLLRFMPLPGLNGNVCPSHGMEDSSTTRRWLLLWCATDADGDAPTCWCCAVVAGV